VNKILEEKWLKIEKIPFLENWYKLLNWREKDLWDLDFFKEWLIYLQSISSQLPVVFMNLEEWNKVLDATAAPWSKTTQIWAKLRNTWNILAIDNNQIRVDKLKFNIKRQWIRNTKVIKLDARKLNKEEYANHFDNILFDAPCSSEWRIDLNREKTYSYWKPEIIKRNYNHQKNILNNIVPMLKEWWELIYSTCTLAPEENEAIVHFLLSNFKELSIVDIIEKLNIKNSRPWIIKFWKTVYRNNVSKSLRILPSKDIDWFFIAKFIKINLT
jgi:16S rRNA C967 or C1407 C5-methylase (RsmB/RsmF family)